MRDNGANKAATDVIDEVVTDHQQIKRLLDQVTTETGDRRDRVFDQLARFIAMHEAAEQAVIHPQMERVADDIAEDRLEEESKGDQMLQRLRTMGVDDPQFDALFAKFKDAVLQHAQHEDQEEHPKLRAKVDSGRLAEMADEFIAAEEDAAVAPGD